MDSIVSGILNQQQAETAFKVQMSVLQKSMDVQRNVGEMLVSLIETSAPPQAMQTPTKTPGLGEKIDLYA